MIKTLTRILGKIRQYLVALFNLQEQLPKEIPDEAIVDYVAELDRSRKNGGH